MSDAQKAYAKRRREIQALLEWIGQEIEDRAAVAGTIQWDAVGDLTFIRDRLIEALCFTTRFDRKEIEAALWGSFEFASKFDQKTSRTRDDNA